MMMNDDDHDVILKNELIFNFVLALYTYYKGYLCMYNSTMHAECFVPDDEQVYVIMKNILKCQ